MARSKPFEFDEASLALLGERMASGSLTAQQLAAAYLERIRDIDAAGPALRAVIELNPDALAIAASLDRERAAGRLRGPLHGMPVLIKDNIATGDRMSTTAGSLALDGVRATDDAPLVRRLRDAGAVILGKTNLSEWANFRSSNSVSGWSSRGGQTRNPYALDRSPSGSSSGSAVAAAANLCAAAVGTETDGSITSPCACNNLVGLKPTLGLVSRAGIVPIAHSQDTAGPMARSVADCALLMNALAAPDAGDAITTSRRVPRGIDFTAALGREQLDGVRLGVARQFFGAFEKADALIEAALDVLRDLGAVLVDLEMPGVGGFDEAELEVLLHEFKHGLDAWLPRHVPHAGVRSLADVIAFNAAHPARVMPVFGQDLLEKAQSCGPLTSRKYRAALARCRRLARTEGIDAAVGRHRVRAIVALTSQPAWIVDPVNGDITRGGCTSLPAVAGYPHLTVPAGFAGRLPVGISFFGPAFSDARLLAIGHAFEQATAHRRAPGFDATAA
ncbi:MAG TPA: amidase [Usitatibacter sp.]|nr:amidase [Usitatibacter sp.]